MPRKIRIHFAYKVTTSKTTHFEEVDNKGNVLPEGHTVLGLIRLPNHLSEGFGGGLTVTISPRKP